MALSGCGDDAGENSDGTNGTDSNATTPTSSGTDSTGGETDGDTDDGVEVVECGELPPVQGTCEVTSVGQGGVILRGSVLAPGTVYRGGSVFVDAGGIIECVDCDCSGVEGAAQASVVTCADGVISPGLINPHDHIGFANNVPMGEGPERYEHRHDWRRGLEGHQELDYESGASAQVVVGQELRFLMSGVTSIASGAGGRPGLIRNLDESGLLEGLPLPVVDSDTFPLDDNDGTKRTNDCNYGNNPATASFVETLNAYLPHIAEGIDAAARNEFLCQISGETDVVGSQTGIIHGIALVPDDARVVADDLARLVWSPRSNMVLYGNTAPVTMLDLMGVSISLGTDWVISGSMNMLRELRCADELNDAYFNGYFSDAQLWRMVTTNAAFAVGGQHAIGMLKPGYVADIAVFRAGERVDHQAIVEGELADVALVLRGGQALYGDDALISSPALGGTSCEGLDVCGSQKRVCLAEDLGDGTTLQSVRSAVEQIYPLFFCETPQLEPTCVPSRPGEYTGIPSDDDPDGDGLTGEADNCPDIFNPIREFEAPVQGDADGDGKGDACDPCPLDDTDSCAVLDANDVDGDGVPNGTDNCPLLVNPMQEDADGDGKGDACDGCPLANPGPTGCPLSIAAIRDPSHPDHPEPGTPVTITGAYVTAIRGSDGFYVQDDSLEPFTGIYVYTGSTPDVQIGNQVTVSGVYEEFFDLSEITSPTVTVDDSGTDLPLSPIEFPDPSDLATGSAQAEQWESMLVQVGPVTIVTQNPDDPDDFDEFTVTGNLRIDDTVSDGVVDEGLNNDCPVGSEFTSIVGIEGFSFGNYKLQPRDAADVAFVDCDPFVP